MIVVFILSMKFFYNEIHVYPNDLLSNRTDDGDVSLTVAQNNLNSYFIPHYPFIFGWITLWYPSVPVCICVYLCLCAFFLYLFHTYICFFIGMWLCLCVVKYGCTCVCMSLCMFICSYIVYCLSVCIVIRSLMCKTCIMYKKVLNHTFCVNINFALYQLKRIYIH